MMTFPDLFELNMRRMLKDEWKDFVSSYDKPFHNGLRVNTLKLSPDSFRRIMSFDGESVPWNPNGFYIDQKRKYSSHPYYHAGLYYLQEASAMLPAMLADAQPGERILDLCAAPGGKSTAVAAAMKGRGLLVSNDISHSRAKALLRNIEGFGITNSIVLSETPERLAGAFPFFFDKILIDAPCSGEGMFHKEPSMMTSWQKNGPEYFQKIQRQILSCAEKMLRPGGRIIYSTCTFSPLEDEQNAAWFLDTYPDFHLIDAAGLLPGNGPESVSHGCPEWADGNEDLKKTLRIWPHRQEGEGHFAAVFEKQGDPAKAVPPAGRRVKIKKELMPFFEFLDKEGIRWQPEAERLSLKNGYLQYLPEEVPDLSGLYIMRCGWYLGELKKNRFEPGGAFARALNPDECDKVINYEADDPQLIRYLKCETLSVDPDLKAGWYLVCVDKFPLGFGKISSGTMKNKYPAGWRLV